MEQGKEMATASVNDVIASTVAYYFAQPNSKDIAYSTSDGNVFDNSGFANTHASTLEDTTVTPHHKADFIEVVGETEVTGGNYELTDADKELLKSGLESKNYNPIKALVKSLKIDTADQKADTLIKALEDYKLANPVE